MFWMNLTRLAEILSVRNAESVESIDAVTRRSISFENSVMFCSNRERGPSERHVESDHDSGTLLDCRRTSVASCRHTSTRAHPTFC